MGHPIQEGATISRSRIPPWVSVLAAAGILVALGLELGARPFLDALDSISVGTVLAALLITGLTTWCCARRWSLLADRLRVGLPMTSAYRAYYRAQFLNATLPSGVVGEVDRAVWHGHTSQAMSRGIRSVVWDRVAGQLVLFGLAVLTIPAVAQPLRTWMVCALVVVVVVVLVASASGSTAVKAVWAEIRAVPGAPDVWPKALVLSILAAAGHVAVFVIAARSVGVSAPTVELIPLGLIVLQVSSIPVGVSGWGPREGGAALVFAAVGLGASTGLAVSVTYGVLATLGTLPGVLALRRRRSAGPTSDPEGDTSWEIVPTRS
jgi:uncharacterized membrane protein YbhN (UPF0104 family)